MSPPKPRNATFLSSAAGQSIHWPDTQLDITDSEFVRFCDEAESEIHSDLTARSNVPISSNSVVDAIFSDFCGSPCSESPPKFLAEDADPIFRFKSESIRTYSGQKRTKSCRNIANEISKWNTSDDDSCASDSASSDISVMEDLSQTVVPQLDTVDWNNSPNIYKNLLSLSVYFTQTSVRDRNFAASGNMERMNVGENEALQEINCDSPCYDKVTLRLNLGQNYNEFEAAADMTGKETINEETTRLTSPINEDNAERVESTISNNLNGQHANTKNDISFLEEEQLFDDNDVWDDSEFLLNYKTQKPQIVNCESDFSRSPGNAFSNQQICRQDIETALPTKSFDSQTELVSASKQTNSEQRMNKKYSDAPFNSKKFYAQIGLGSSHFQGFSTAAMKPIAISDMAKLQDDEILQKFENDELELKAHSALCSNRTLKKLRREDSTAKNIDPTNPLAIITEKCCLSTSAPPLVGFSTALRKPIFISAEAKQKADEIIQKFEQKERERQLNEKWFQVSEDDKKGNKKPKYTPGTMHRNIPKINELCQKSVEVLCSPAFSGFSTVCEKSKETCDIAKQKTEDVISKSDERDKSLNKFFHKPTPATKSSMDLAFNSGFHVFSTASSKPISISDEAKRKADEIIRKFEEVEHDLGFHNPNTPTTSVGSRQFDVVADEVTQKEQDLLIDVIFLDDAFEEEMKTIEQGRETTVNFAKSSKFQLKEVAICDGFKTTSKNYKHVSKNSKDRAKNLLKAVEFSNLSQDYLKCIEADLDETETKSIVDPTWNSEKGNRAPKLKSMTEIKDTVSQSDVGFARIGELNSEDEEYLNFMRNKSLKQKRRVSCANSLPVSPISNLKEGFIDHAPTSSTENTGVCKTSSAPLIKTTRSSEVYSRKNLLSLSNLEKKVDSPGRVGDESPAPKTPERGKPTSIDCYSNTTPNLKEFFDSVSTSTPLLLRRIKDGEATLNNKSLDDDNNSTRLYRTSSLYDSNVSCADVSPTPNQQIERPVSPILMANCRQPGFHRGRRHETLN